MLEKTTCEKFYLFADTFVNTNDLEIDDFFKRVFDSLFSLIPEAEKGSFYHLEDDSFKAICSKGYDVELLHRLEFNAADMFVGFESCKDETTDAYCLSIEQRDESRFSEEIIETFKRLGTYENFQSLYAPIKFEEKKIGLICLDNFSKVPFSKNSKLILKIYAQMISNFYTRKMHQKIQAESYNDIISALVTAIEIKDPYTVGHAKRVARYSDQISEVLKLPQNRRDIIKTAAILHDIGKIGIPSDILNKPGQLTADEYEIVKLHPENTKKILGKINGMDEVIQLAFMHHEHYDGSGYPHGLKNPEIPIEAQVIQCADAYDAMTSVRSYRKALSAEQVRNIFLSEKGKQFHPQIVDVIISLYL